MTGFFGQEDEPSEQEFPRVLKSYMGGDIYGTGR